MYMMKKSELTRQQILDTAYDIFSTKGWDATNLQDIADQLGITRGPIYYYFKNKLELYNAVVEYSVGNYALQSKACIEGSSPFCEMLECLLNTWLRLRQVSNLTNELVSKPELAQQRTIYTNYCDEAYLLLTKRIRQEQEAGILRSHFPPESLTEWIYVFFNGLLCMVKSPVKSQCKESPEEMIRYFVDIVRTVYAAGGNSEK